MNWSLGFFRLWSVFAVFWLGGSVVAFYDSGLISPKYENIEVSVDELRVTQKEGEIWEVAYDSVMFEVEIPAQVEVGSTQWSNMLQATAVEISKNIALKNASMRIQHRQNRNAFILVASFPLFLLAMGFAARWIILGFRQT